MEQTITTAIEQAKTSMQEQQALSVSSVQKELQNILHRYPKFEDFAVMVNPDTQLSCASDERKTIMGNYATLALLDKAYGSGAASSWLVPAIANLNTFTGSKNMNDDQTEKLATLIAQEYKDMKYSVMQLFFYRFKCGHFGKFYGKVDPMVIICALKDFAEECEQKREEYQTEEYLNKVDDEDTFRKDVYRYWYNLCQELFSLVNPEDKDTLTSIDVAEIYTEDKCLEISLTKQQYELLTGTYKDLFSTLKKKYFSNIVKLLRYKLN